jgi:DtxR family Mn-dependent transcriptional regulator
MAEKNVVEEVLEFIWFERERGVDSLKELLNIEEVVEAGAGIDTIEEMKEHDLIVVHGDSVHLTGKGEKQAELVIRRHRLAELLLSEVLEVAEGQLEKNACSFEHSLSPVVTDNICTLLGHPPNCPHGFPIPKGECCKKAPGSPFNRA